MNAVAAVPTIPREQFPAQKFLSFFRQPLATHAAGDPCRLSFFWARNALFYALKALGIPPGARVLLPAYLCRAAVEPFEVHGTDVEFYSINRRCEPDLVELERRITAQTKAVLVVHYFGFPQRIAALRELCDCHRLFLIEDCAHVLQGSADGAPLGSFGDASVFSWRKFLPIYDGGDLCLRRAVKSPPPAWQQESFLFTLKVAKSLADKIFENSTGTLLSACSVAIESVKSTVKGLRKKSGDAPLFELDSNRATFDPGLVNQGMSRLSRWLTKHSDISAIAANRRENYWYLSERLRGLPRVTLLHAELPNTVCPWVFPVILDGIPHAHLRLQEEGIPAVNWQGVRPPALRLGAHPDADFLYDNLVFLPIHQNITSKGLESIVSAVKKVSASATSQRGPACCWEAPRIS